MTPRPRCECHGVPMTRRGDRSVGYRCTVGHLQAQDRYRESKGGRMARRDAWLARTAKLGEERSAAARAEIAEILAAHRREHSA